MPWAQLEYSAPGPPSSQSPSLAYWQLLAHVPGTWGGAGLGEGAAGGVGGKRQFVLSASVMGSPAQSSRLTVCAGSCVMTPRVAMHVITWGGAVRT